MQSVDDQSQAELTEQSGKVYGRVNGFMIAFANRRRATIESNNPSNLSPEMQPNDFLFRHILRLIACPVFILISSLPIQAQLPFYTDDADTTPRNKFHIEISDEHDILQTNSYPTKRQNTVVFTLNYGITDKLELGVNAPIITFSNSRVAARRNISGQGDIQFGLKYNFLAEREVSKMPALGLVFYVEAPSGSVRKGTGSGLYDYWLYGIVQKSITKKTKVRLNGGVLFSGDDSTGLIGIKAERGHVYTGNASLVRNFNDKWTLGIEVFGAVTGNFKLDRGQLTTQIGGNYALTEKFSLAFGILSGKFSVSPRAGALLGFAYDF